MHIITVNNVNEALHEGLYWLDTVGTEELSRNGPVVVSPDPVCTVYHRPWQRVLFSPLRDANPWFHLFEALWMLAGRNDVAFVAQFAKQLTAYSDDGETLHGAYGARWRGWFGYDQLIEIAQELRADPASRRCVLTMWDATAGLPSGALGDLGTARSGGKDVPCNTHVYVDVRGGALNITVCCRSNDVLWGAYGANAVHFSMLQEWLAAAVGVPMGVYRQISNNFHAYTATCPRSKFLALADDARIHDVYADEDIVHHALVQAIPHADAFVYAQQWLLGAEAWCRNPSRLDWQDNFFTHVARPMYCAWHRRKHGEPGVNDYVAQIAARDWRLACSAWLQRHGVYPQRKEATSGKL